MKRLMQLKERHKKLVEQQRSMLNALGETGTMSAEQDAQYKALDAQREELAADINRETALIEAERVANGALPVEPAPAAAATKPAFDSLGAFLVAVANAAMPGGTRDPRLMGAASGMNEGVGSEGGFAVHQDFIKEILGPVYNTGEILRRVKRVPLSSGANGVKYNVIDEESRANGSRFGGVRMFWQAEAGTVNATMPKLRQIALDLKKIIGIGYATDELLTDAGALQATMLDAFRTELAFSLEDAVIRGSGSGQPLGILNSPATVSQAIESTQTIANSDQFIAKNVAKMLARVPSSLWADAVFFYNPELLATLITATVGGTAAIPVMMPPGGLSGSPYGTILGRPAIPLDYCEAVGTPGDLILASLSQYAMADKGEAKLAESMHVRFLYDEMTFRLTYRCDGQPEWVKALTPYKGAATRSPFVTLATRS